MMTNSKPLVTPKLKKILILWSLFMGLSIFGFAQCPPTQIHLSVDDSTPCIQQLLHFEVSPYCESITYTWSNGSTGYQMTQQGILMMDSCVWVEARESRPPYTVLATDTFCFNGYLQDTVKVNFNFIADQLKGLTDLEYEGCLGNLGIDLTPVQNATDYYLAVYGPNGQVHHGDITPLIGAGQSGSIGTLNNISLPAFLNRTVKQAWPDTNGNPIYSYSGSMQFIRGERYVVKVVGRNSCTDWIEFAQGITIIAEVDPTFTTDKEIYCEDESIIIHALEDATRGLDRFWEICEMRSPLPPPLNCSGKITSSQAVGGDIGNPDLKLVYHFEPEKCYKIIQSIHDPCIDSPYY